MDITKYFSRKHSLEPPSTADQVEDDSEVHSEPPSKVQAIQLEDMEAQDIKFSQPKGEQRPQRKKCTNLTLAIEKNGKKHTRGFTALILRKECFVVCARTLERPQ